MIRDGWVDWAVRIDGIPDKVYSKPNSGEWLTCHSIVGQEWEYEDGVPNRFLSTASYIDEFGRKRYTDYAAASCMFILRKNGVLIQMYPLSASTWTSGGSEANTRSFAIEAEGGLAPDYGEPLTPEAEATFIKLYWELARHQRWNALTPWEHLKQHKDVAREFKTSATACASDRYANVWQRLFRYDGLEEDDMTPAEAKGYAAEVFDANFSVYFLRAMRQYFTDTGAGDFSNAPEPEVAAAIRAIAGVAPDDGETRKRLGLAFVNLGEELLKEG